MPYDPARLRTGGWLAWGAHFHSVASESQLATMPGKDELRAQLLMTLQAPLTQFVQLLQAPAQNFVYLLKAKEDQG